MRLHVVIVSNDARLTGGAAAVAIESARGLVAAGAAVTLFAGVGPVDESLIGVGGLEVVCLGCEPNGRGGGVLRGLWDRRSARALQDLLERCPSGRTVVHFHSYVETLSGSVTAVPPALGVPAILTLHDYSLACPYGGFYNYRTQAPCGKVGLSAGCWLTNCSTSRYPRKLWRNARLAIQKARGGIPNVGTAIAYITEFGLDVQRPYLPDGVRVFRIPNPIAVAQEPRVEAEHNENFLFIGRLTPEKAPELFAEAAARAGVPAVFVGDGPMRESVLRACPKATVTGWVTPDVVLGHVRKARAVCVPSRLYEGGPLAVFDALSHGVPPIVSDGCAGREFFESGQAGLWFKGGDVEDLARQIDGMRDAARVRAMSAIGYERYWADPPTAEAHTRRLLQVYGELLGDSP